MKTKPTDSSSESLARLLSSQVKPFSSSPVTMIHFSISESRHATKERLSPRLGIANDGAGKR
jgi:hypothetical protein